MAPKVAIVFVRAPIPFSSDDVDHLLIALQYSMYGHIQKMAEAEKKGIESAGGQVDIYQYVTSCYSCLDIQWCSHP